MRVCPYLNFDGQTEEAMTFYARALGGELTEVHRFGSMPGMDLSEEQADRVMHVGVKLAGGVVLMASDTMQGMGPPHIVGTNSSVSVHPDSRAQADRMFAALAEGGQVTMPLQDQFWGDYYGSCTDRFGVQWMINYNEAGLG